MSTVTLLLGCFIVRCAVAENSAIQHRLIAIVLAAQFTPAVLWAQIPPARLTVTVVDTTGGVIPEAKEAVTIQAQSTSLQGAVVFAGLQPGRYDITATFAGFQPGFLSDVRLRPGENRHILILKIQVLQATVNVADDETAASNRTSTTFGVRLSDAQLEGLSDDPDELAQQLRGFAGPNAVIRVDSFEGTQLPPKAQIKSIHVTRDQFAAETANPGDTFIDIITQPGVGAIRGTFNGTMRAGAMSARSPFASARGLDDNERYGLTIGGTLKANVSSFSLNVNRSRQNTAPILYATTPDGGTQAQTLNVTTPRESVTVSALLDYAVTRDQTLRFGYYDTEIIQKNQGIGAFDFPERAYANQNVFRIGRVQHGGPIGRRLFINTRLFLGTALRAKHSAAELPTVTVRDASTTGGAQVRGSQNIFGFIFASDVDYIRGIHSWRIGLSGEGGRVRSDSETNYLGTFTFANVEALTAGTPSLYTRSLGHPLIKYLNNQIGVYVQDDLRISRGLTASPGLRFTTQNIARYHKSLEPRFGLTWSPRTGGNLTLRASVGIFHDWMQTDTYEQALRLDGVHQQEIVVRDPPYPDVSVNGVVPVPNRYLIGTYPLPMAFRYSTGIERRFSTHLRVSTLYSYIHQSKMARGENLNPSANGVRPDPRFANIIETVSDGTLLRHELNANLSINIGSSEATTANAALLDWQRVVIVGSYQWVRARQNVVSPFEVPPSGRLVTEWGNGPNDSPYWFNANVTSTQLRNLNIGVTLQGNDGVPYMETTGFDDNQDGLLNDRPATTGVWALRGTPQFTITTRVAYTLTRGAPTQPRSSGVPYRFVMFINVNNVTNRHNYAGFSGVMSSPFFRRPTLVINPRRIEMGVSVMF
jgi:hypothetical protein